MHKTWILFVGGMTLCTMLFTACGGDGNLSAAEFRKEANAICTRANRRIGEAIGPVIGGTSATAVQKQDALDMVVSITRGQLREIHALDAPSSMRTDVNAMVSEGMHATNVAKSQGAAFFDTDGDPWSHTQELAADLGLDACSGD
jgi:hypothetical protein